MVGMSLGGVLQHPAPPPFGSALPQCHALKGARAVHMELHPDVCRSLVKIVEALAQEP